MLSPPLLRFTNRLRYRIGYGMVRAGQVDPPAAHWSTVDNRSRRLPGARRSVVAPFESEESQAIPEPTQSTQADRERVFTDMLREVAAVSIAAKRVEPPVRRTMEMVCNISAFDLAHAIVERPGPDGESEVVHLWYPRKADDFQAFRRASGDLTLKPDPHDGLIGRPLAESLAQWQERLQVPDPDGYDPRWAAAAESGLRSGFALPIVSEDRVCGVVEWLSRQRLDRDERLMEVGGSIGDLLGLALQRAKLERAISNTLWLQQRRVGRELHDGLCQDLVGLGMQCRRLRTLRRKGDDQQADRILAQVVSAVDDAVDKARAMSRGLAPIEIDASGLIEALDRLAKNVTERFGVECSLEVLGEPPVADDTAAVHLYYIVCEAVHNAARHSGASRIKITLSDDFGSHVLRIRDDGAGLPATADPTPGMGLRLMKHRASLINADLTIDSAPDAGTEVICRLSRGDV